MRSMARLEDGSDQALVEAKAVDAAYPLYGALVTEPALPRDELFGERDGVFGAAAPDLLFERLGMQPGARIKLGTATFELRAKLVTEPDAASDGFGFAPRLMVSLDGLARLGAGPARQPGRARLQDAAAGQPSEARTRRDPRTGGAAVSRGWLGDPHARQRRAVAVARTSSASRNS